MHVCNGMHWRLADCMQGPHDEHQSSRTAKLSWPALFRSTCVVTGYATRMITATLLLANTSRRQWRTVTTFWSQPQVSSLLVATDEGGHPKLVMISLAQIASQSVNASLDCFNAQSRMACSSWCHCGGHCVIQVFSPHHTDWVKLFNVCLSQFKFGASWDKHECVKNVVFTSFQSLAFVIHAQDHVHLDHDQSMPFAPLCLGGISLGRGRGIPRNFSLPTGTQEFLGKGRGQMPEKFL